MRKYSFKSYKISSKDIAEANLLASINLDKIKNIVGKENHIYKKHHSYSKENLLHSKENLSLTKNPIKVSGSSYKQHIRGNAGQCERIRHISLNRVMKPKSSPVNTEVPQEINFKPAHYQQKRIQLHVNSSTSANTSKKGVSEYPLFLTHF